MPQFIYVMKGLGKVHPPDHVVLKDIWLSFLPAAKIGVLGLNGAGKSSLLKIMAGQDTEFLGEAFLAQGSTAGYLPQEPHARSVEDRPRDRRRGRRRDARAPRPLRRDQREVRRGPVARGDGQGPRGAGQGPGSHRRAERLGPRLAARVRDGRAALPAARHAGDAALRRRATPRRAVPPAAEAARSAAPRRADQPPRRRVGGLAREAPQGLPGHRRRGDARSLLPRQRRRLDPRARSRQRHSVGRQLLVVARAEAAAARARGEVREPAPAHAAARAGVDPPVAAGPPGQGQGAPQRLRAAAQRGRAAEDRQGRDLHRAGPAPRRRRGRGQGPAQGVRRHAADRRLELPPAEAAASSASSARTAPARPRCSR